MITYVPDLIQLLKTKTGNVLVTTTYPDTNIVPIVIVYESDQTELFTCSEYEHATSTVTVEIYAKDIPSRNELKNNIDKVLRELKFELIKKEDIDSTLYVSKLTYECELIQRGNLVKIYNKKQQ